MTTGKPIFRPFFPWLPALIAGILLGEKYPGYAVWILFTTIVLMVVLIFFLIRSASTFIFPILLLGCAGYLSIQPWTAASFPEHHIRNFTDDRKYRITGVIKDIPYHYRNRTRFILWAESVVQGGVSVPVCGRIRVTVRGKPIPLAKGQGISFFSRVRLIRNFSNPGGFDYERYMAFKFTWVSASVSSERITTTAGDRKTGPLDVVDDYRVRMASFIDTTEFRPSAVTNDIRAVLKALLIGDRSGISKSLRQKFNRSGVGHLLAISGLHMGIVATVAFMGLRWLLSFSRVLLWSGGVKKTAAIFSLFPILAYGLLAGMSPSTQRALIMVAVFLLTFLIDRDQDLLNTIAFAALVILIAHPPSIFSISFQLSFAAVFSIVVGMSLFRPISFAKKRFPETAIRRILTFIGVTLLATIGTAPLVMHYFNQVSLIGIVANLIMVPLVGFFVVPLGLMSVVWYAFSTAAASFSLKMSGEVLAVVIKGIAFLADLPFAALRTITPNYFEITCFYMLLFGSLYLLAWKTGVGKNAIDTSMFRKRVVGLAMITALVGLVLDIGYWTYYRLGHSDLRVTYFDVGQGSAALLELPKGYNVLIDGGGFSDNTVFDTGAMIIAPLLWRKKIKTIDTIVLTHPNSDHLNGLIYIAEHFNVQQAITNNETSSTKGYCNFVETLEKNHIHEPRYATLEKEFEINGVAFKILHPVDDFLGRKGESARSNTNNNSLVLKVSYGRHAFLFPGDIMTMAEKNLAANKCRMLKSAILLAPHHGSATSSTKSFLACVEPEIVVVSAGWKNRFNFPQAMVVGRYQEMGCRILRTDMHGAVTIVTDGEEMGIRSTRKYVK